MAWMTEDRPTVEALTAEVRALMVGTRQVTLSGYRQLDDVHPDCCEPFGRVRDSRDRAGTKNLAIPEPTIYVIGRSVETGALVRASRFKPRDPRGSFAADPSRASTDEVTEYERELARYREWSDLPLIVLGGLR
jgi:hypothetical protein